MNYCYQRYRQPSLSGSIKCYLIITLRRADSLGYPVRLTMALSEDGSVPESVEPTALQPLMLQERILRPTTNPK